MDHTKISVIIPAYNEAEVIGDVLKQIISAYPDFEVIVVNDGSSDNTGQIAKEAGAIVYSHPYNIGNGAAIKSGIRIASGEILFEGTPEKLISCNQSYTGRYLKNIL